MKNNMITESQVEKLIEVSVRRILKETSSKLALRPSVKNNSKPDSEETTNITSGRNI